MKWYILIPILSITLTTVACTNEKPAQKTVEQNNVISEAVDWTESPRFEVDQYMMIGEEGRVGFIYDDTEVTRFYPNKEQKYMWHFWGNDNELEGPLKVIASHKESGTQHTILKNHPLGGPNNGADQHAPSMMSLPKSGLWKLDAYIGEKLFGTIIVKVHEA